MKKVGVYIGRFQPFHNAHLSNVREALGQVDQLVIVLGSAGKYRTWKNPFTMYERTKLIVGALTESERERIQIIAVDDYDSNADWTNKIVQDVATTTSNVTAENITLFGHAKDESTFYLSLFPQWKFVDVCADETNELSATFVRNAWMNHDDLTVANSVPNNVYQFLKDFRSSILYTSIKLPWKNTSVQSVAHPHIKMAFEF